MNGLSLRSAVSRYSSFTQADRWRTVWLVLRKQCRGACREETVAGRRRYVEFNGSHLPLVWWLDTSSSAAFVGVARCDFEMAGRSRVARGGVSEIWVLSGCIDPLCCVRPHMLTHTYPDAATHDNKPLTSLDGQSLQSGA